ncbi:LysR family transcriptional regulator [Amycolatopsis magusensis]|uniref:DNA-binding transcriptional LysR family regulator n=1 Tax=Amycolatopsis magusensis TaxID=882444 RepID=A0ABS4PZA6_9PSEU|nr:LysR substrate-binding domain-containing protein [Amycolatopsis magusensis]MBP2184759.1 DNA-binding transcriptional LysR family regulator [Amycolatopsis magusensis]MDI5974728.1 LysR substrate-binding domain-containing protein [Amycolatopsis magusensis]
MAGVDIDTRVLRYFLAVAEDLSFTRAAERLYVSQPALSRQIRQLEADLQLLLFERTSREVRLTLAGEALLPSARRLVADWQTAQRTVRSVAAAELRVLRIGFEATGAGPLSAKARTLFTERHPDVTVEPKRFDWGGEVAALREGLVDIAFLWLPADTTGLHAEIVAVEPRMVGFAAGHRLAAQETVTIGDLADEPLMWTRKAPRHWVDWWAVNPRPDGSEPRWGPENDNVEEMLENVAGGAAVCIGPRSMSTYYARPDLGWRPIVDVEPLRIAFAWPAASNNPLVADFAKVVRELAAAQA